MSDVSLPPDIYAAGILPVINDKYVLLGRERRMNKKYWSDFGGGVKAHEKSDPLSAAVRELLEESCCTILYLVPDWGGESNGAATTTTNGLRPLPSTLVECYRILHRHVTRHVRQTPQPLLHSHTPCTPARRRAYQLYIVDFPDVAPVALLQMFHVFARRLSMARDPTHRMFPKGIMSTPRLVAREFLEKDKLSLIQYNFDSILSHQPLRGAFRNTMERLRYDIFGHAVVPHGAADHVVYQGGEQGG